MHKEKFKFNILRKMFFSFSLFAHWCTKLSQFQLLIYYLWISSRTGRYWHFLNCLINQLMLQCKKKKISAFVCINILQYNIHNFNKKKNFYSITAPLLFFVPLYCFWFLNTCRSSLIIQNLFIYVYPVICFLFVKNIANFFFFYRNFFCKFNMDFDIVFFR